MFPRGRFLAVGLLEFARQCDSWNPGRIHSCASAWDQNVHPAAWDVTDLTMEDGTTIEVKSGAYLQAWEQKGESVIVFTGVKTKGWTPLKGYDRVPDYHADNIRILRSDRARSERVRSSESGSMGILCPATGSSVKDRLCVRIGFYS